MEATFVSDETLDQLFLAQTSAGKKHDCEKLSQGSPRAESIRKLRSVPGWKRQSS
jgi:hypothetical protein